MLDQKVRGKREGLQVEIVTERLALQNQMREAYLSSDYPSAGLAARELIRIGDEAGGDPWNEWPYVTAKLVLFRVLNPNPVLICS